MGACGGGWAAGWRRWWSHTFLLDWAGVVALVVVVMVANEAVDWLRTSEFDVADMGLAHPLHSDTVNMITVGIIVVVPALVIGVFFAVKRNDYLEDLHAFALAMVAPIVLAYAIWAIIGNATGKPRPDFLARCAPACMQGFTWECAPDAGLYDAPCEDSACCPVMCNIQDPRYPEVVPCTYTQNGTYRGDVSVQETCSKIWRVPVTIEIAQCKGYEGAQGYSQYSIREGFKSFPSGHTLVAFNAATTVWFYVLGKLQVVARGVQLRLFCNGLLYASFMWFLAAYVAVTRYHDHKHDWFDIVVGALMGVLTSLIVYMLYFQDPRVGGEPLRRPGNTKLGDVLLCRKAALQQPWPAVRSHVREDDGATPPDLETAELISNKAGGKSDNIAQPATPEGTSVSRTGSSEPSEADASSGQTEAAPLTQV